MDWNGISDEELEQLISDESLEKRGKALETLGMRYASVNNYTVARVYLEQAVEVNDQVGDVEWASTSRQILGRVLYNLGEYDDAIAWLSEAALGFQSILWHRVLAETLQYRAAVHRAASNTAGAISDWGAAFSGFMGSDRPVMAAEALTEKADYEIFLGWYCLAYDTLTRALDVLRTEPAFDERTRLHTQRIRLATALGRDATEDLQEGKKVVTLAKSDGVDLEFAAWSIRYLISTEHLDEAETALMELEGMPDSHARTQHQAVLGALLQQAKGEPVDDVAKLEAAHMIATSYQDYEWLPITTRLLALHHVAHDEPLRGAKLIADTVSDIMGASSTTDVCDLEILCTEIEALAGDWGKFENFLLCTPISFDDHFVDHFGRMLMLAIRYAILTDAPTGEIIQRLNAATAQTWLLPDEYRPGGRDGFIPEDSHVLITVPEEIRAFGFHQAAEISYFQGVRETLGDEPLGSPIFHMDLAFLKPAVTRETATAR
jgi:tetratricopeptide (TPR) repeat protein